MISCQTEKLTFTGRSGTPLIYRAIPAWFVRVTPIVDELVDNNARTRWFVSSVYAMLSSHSIFLNLHQGATERGG
jgi:isoleucyl-tRNA synthetase